MIIWGNLVVSFGVILAITLLLSAAKDPLFFFLPLTFVGMGNGLTLPNSNAGIVSLHPKLAGSASGLGGFLQVMLGAAFSIFAGFILGPLSYPMPLLILMLVLTLIGTFWAYYVIYIDRQEARENIGQMRNTGVTNEES